MSRRKMKSRDRLALKNTRDGVVEQNVATGEETRISNREADFDLRSGTPETEPFSQVGKRPDSQKTQTSNQSSTANRKQTYRHHKSDSTPETSQSAAHEPETPSLRHQTDTPSTQTDVAQSTETSSYNTPTAETAQQAPLPDGGRVPLKPQNAVHVPPATPSKRNKQYSKHQPKNTDDAPVHDTTADTPAREPPKNTDVQPDTAPIATPQEKKTESKLNTETNSRLQFSQEESAPAPKGKRKQTKPRVDSDGKPLQESPKPDETAIPSETPVQNTPSSTRESAQTADTTAKPDPTPKSKPKPPKLETQEATALKPDKPGKLQFTPDEAKPDAPKPRYERKLNKAQSQADKAATKLEKARDNLPSKRKLKQVTVVDDKSGVAKKKLQFEKTPISQGEHMRGSRLLSPVKTASNALVINTHRKLYQVEHENVGVKAAHRVEMIGEAGVRSALRFRKTAPYRHVAKLERAAQKRSVDLAYRKTIAQNPKLKSNMLTRALQKRKIKKDYAKAAREAQKAAKRAKNAGKTTARIAKALVLFVKRHPIITVIVILVALLLYTIMSLVGAIGGAGSGGFGAIVASTYLAEDADMYAAQDAYADMEADLQYQLDNYEILNPGYDEYVFELDTIWHDPYVLMSILGALHDGAWTLDSVQATLSMLFDMQYTLTETVTVETRYRTETTTQTDPLTGDEYEVSEDVAYEYHIVTVTLENFNLSHLPIYIMGEERLSRYALFTATLGNRPDLFPVSVYPHASYYMDYLRYDVPEAYLADEIFAAMITEANKYLGMPYVWGGYNPRTSFDCSGYVSWVLNNSGWNIGRLGAQGLYNFSTPVSAADAKPGDLVFFHSTYRAPNPVTHVGIYVGDGMMVHAGNPIGYVSIETTYWQNHFYAFGRVY